MHTEERFNVAELRFTMLPDASKDLGVLAPISDALGFCRPYGANHSVQFFLRRRLTLDETMVFVVLK